VSKSVLRQAMSIEWRGIEQADAAPVGSLQRPQCPLGRYSLVEIPQRSAAQSQNADLQISPANTPLLKSVHCSLYYFAALAVVSEPKADHVAAIQSSRSRMYLR